MDDLSDEMLEDARMLYNVLVENQAARRRSKLRDPIDILPTEIWIQMIQQAVARLDGKSVEDLLVLTLVSIRWRDSIMTCPELWTEIELGPGLGQPDLMVRLVTCLYLSSTYPLTLFIQYPTRDWEIVVSELQQHAGRIKQIRIKPVIPFVFNASFVYNPSIPQILDSLGHLLQLMTLDLNSIWSFDHALLDAKGDVPPFDKTITWLLHPSLLGHTSLESVKQISTAATIPTLSRWISAHPDLQSLEYVSDPPSMTGELSSKEIPQTSLRILTAYSMASNYLFSLLSASPRLVKLSLRVFWSSMVEFIEILPLLHCLDDLSLEIIHHETQYALLHPRTTAPFPPLRHLYILHRPDRQGAYRNRSRLAQLNATALYQILETNCSKVISLTIDATLMLDIPFRYLGSLSRLQSLHLHFLNLYNIGKTRIELPSLGLLHLAMPAEAISQILSNIGHKNILKLVLEVAKNHDLFDQPELDLSSYQTLRVLEWGFDGLLWIPRTLNSLETLVFRDSGLVSSGDFCVYLAKRPHDCPKLKTILFHFYPEWDLLFIMLERRNFLADSRISHIDTISLPSTISPSLGRALASLLKGQFTVRPSNHQISFAGIAENIWNPSITGCYWCLYSFQNCSLSTSIRRSDDIGFLSRPNKYVQSIRPQPPLDHDLVEWLEQRQSRYDNSLSPESGRDVADRRAGCGKHQLKGIYTATGLKTNEETTFVDSSLF